MNTPINARPLEIAVSSVSVCCHRGGLEIVDELADEWRDFSDEATDDQPFYRPEWFQAHIRTFLPDAKVRLIVARLNGRLCLVLPLIEEKGRFGKLPVRKLRAPVNVHGDRFDAMRRSGPEGEAAIRATWQFLSEMGGWDVLQFRNSPLEGTVDRLVTLAQASGFPTLRRSDRPNPFIPVPSDPELLARMPPNSKLRSQLRQVRRRLAELGGLRFYRVDTADREALDRFYQLEVAGWKGQEGTAILRNGSKPFYDEMAGSAARFGYFSLFMLELNGEPLAGHFAFTHRDRCYSPIVTYNEKFGRFAPGHLIVSEILQYCAARGIRAYDITGQDQEWKMKWTTEAHPFGHFYVFKGPLGNLAYDLGFRLRSATEHFLPKVRRIIPF